MAGLECLLNLLLKKAEVLADFREILVLLCETLKQGEFALVAMVIESMQSLLPSTRLIFVFFNWKLHLRQDKSETCCFEELCVRVGTLSPSR